MSHWNLRANDKKASRNARLEQEFKDLVETVMSSFPKRFESSKLDCSKQKVAWGGAKDTLSQKQIVLLVLESTTQMIRWSATARICIARTTACYRAIRNPRFAKANHQSTSVCQNFLRRSWHFGFPRASIRWPVPRKHKVVLSCILPFLVVALFSVLPR